MNNVKTIKWILCLICLILIPNACFWRNLNTRIEIAEQDLKKAELAGAKQCEPESFLLVSNHLYKARTELANDNTYQASKLLKKAQTLQKTVEQKLAFCLQNDQDSDKLPDFLDKDPLHPEDFDEFQDEDGIPDPDNDSDSIPDIKDQCPLKPEDFDEFSDEDGCPDPDNDQDGILDEADADPNRAEDKDHFHDQDGIPDLDNDNDGVLDEQDGAPNTPETLNGYMDEDGIPDEPPKRFPIASSKKLEIKEPIRFAQGRTDIMRESFKILDEIATTLKKNPQLRMTITGYTDNRGDSKKNLKLSQQRAESVKNYLTLKGISAGRLTAIGKGDSEPLASNDTEAGRAKNRRIEFVVY